MIGLLQLALVQLAVGQSTDNNGRPAGAEQQKTTQQEPGTQHSTTGDVFDGDDFDQPANQVQGEQATTIYPQDIAVLQDELLNSATPGEVVEQVEALRRLVADLNRTTEELRRENRLIRRSIGACCSRDDLGFTANDAYLLQNTPNPSNGRTMIQYFVPENLNNVQIELRDVKGVLVETIDVEASGMDEVIINSSRYQSGTYLYYLSIDGKVIDSKVMIINQ
jgi:hypothetical protein